MEGGADEPFHTQSRLVRITTRMKKACSSVPLTLSLISLASGVCVIFSGGRRHLPRRRPPRWEPRLVGWAVAEGCPGMAGGVEGQTHPEAHKEAALAKNSTKFPTPGVGAAAAAGSSNVLCRS